MTTHADYTNVTDRIAKRLIQAAIANATSDALTLTSRGRYTIDGIQTIVVRVARQIARQGLLPTDLDHDAGYDALHAIAVTVARAPTTAIAWANMLQSLPDDWKHAVNAAGRQLERAFREMQQGVR